MSRRVVVVTAALLLLAAGVAGLVASRHPDGLMYVAERTGLAGRQRSGHPMAGGWAGRVAGGLAVLVVAAGLFRLLARGDRSRDGGHDEGDEGGGL